MGSVFVKVFNYFLVTYVTDEIIAQAIKQLKYFKKTPGVSAALYAKVLYTKTQRYGIIYEEKRVKKLFVQGLGALICDNMCVFLEQHPCLPLTELARYADSLIKIADWRLRRSESSKYNRTRSTVRPNSLYATAVLASDDDGQESILEAATKS